MKLTIASALTVGSMMLATQTAHAATEILVNNFVSASHPITYGILEPWAKRVEEASNGELKIVYPAATLAPPNRQWNMVTHGIADVGYMFNAHELKRLALAQMYHLPFITPSAETAGVAMNRVHQRYFAAANEYDGVILLGQFSFVGNEINTSSTPINSVADLKNLKIRTAPGVGKEAFNKLGAVVVTTPGSRSFEVVSKGIVDGLALSLDDVVSYKMVPYIKFVTVVPGAIYNSGFSLFMNPKKFQKLSQKDQAAVMKASGEAIGRDSRALDERNASARKEMEAAGTKIQTASPAMIAELREKLAFLENDWLESVKDRPVDAAAALAFYKQEIANIEKASGTKAK